MALSYPTIIPGLRSPFDQVHGIVYFGRMLDKIRLAAAGKLPEGWQPMRGTTVKGTFDGRCCSFLHIDYAALEAATLKGGSDAARGFGGSAQQRQHALQACPLCRRVSDEAQWAQLKVQGDLTERA